jgi:hypothetical protein
LGLDTNNWVRFWTNSAAGAVLAHQEIGWTNGIPTPIGVPNIATHLKANLATPPGLVWAPNATLKAGSVSISGTTATIPLTMTVQPGSVINGMQFRAIVSALNGAATPGSVSFASAPGIPNASVISGLSSQEAIRVWPVPLGNTGGLDLQGTRSVGTLSFSVPAGASAQSYTVNFVGVDGLPNLQSQYQLESIPPGQITSDEWRMKFFGSTTSAAAQDNADPDGDGVPNWAEYLAGTDPTSASSVLQFSGASSASAGAKSINLGWMTAPGKTYVVESSPTLNGTVWTAVNTSTGDGYGCQVTLTNASGGTKFYRISVQQ